MIVDMKHKHESEELNIRNILLQLISLFGCMQFEEILDYFPTNDEGLIKTIVFELVNTRQLLTQKSSDKNTYFLTQNQADKKTGLKMRQEYYEISCFIRYLLNCKNSEGYLINTIDCIGTNTFPFKAFIVCNNSIYDIAHCPGSKIAIYEQVLSRKDKVWDETEAKFKKTQAADAPYIITEDKNRIIIVDKAEDMNLIHFRKVKYIVCRQDKQFLMKAGD